VHPGAADAGEAGDSAVIKITRVAIYNKRLSFMI
jgi:hypothetical protein